MVHPILFGVKEVFEVMAALRKTSHRRFYKHCFDHPRSAELAKRYSEYLKKRVRLVLNKETDGREVMIPATYPPKTPAPPCEVISAWPTGDGPHNLMWPHPSIANEVLSHDIHLHAVTWAIRVDFLEHSGINIPPEYRFRLRFVTTCALPKMQGYTRETAHATTWAISSRFGRFDS